MLDVILLAPYFLCTLIFVKTHLFQFIQSQSLMYGLFDSSVSETSISLFNFKFSSFTLPVIKFYRMITRIERNMKHCDLPTPLKLILQIRRSIALNS